MDALWAKKPVLTIDGGLGTEIERRGVSINVSVTRMRSASFLKDTAQHLLPRYPKLE